MFRGMGQVTFKDELEGMVKDRLSSYGSFPPYITPEMKNRIRGLQDDFQTLQRTKKFTKERGIEMMNELDDINSDISKMRKQSQELDEDRKKKHKQPKLKRKITKRKK